MRTILALLFALLIGPATAQVPMTGAGKSTVAVAYQGPADIVASPKVWIGLRAMSAADRGNRLINICDPSNVTCADWSSDAITGKLAVGTNPLNGTDCTVSTSCTIKTFYDRSGALNCTGAACDVTNNTAASRATLTWNCINSLPCAVFTGTQAMQTAASFTALTQPFSISDVTMRASGTTHGLPQTGANVTFGYGSSANAIRYFAGSGTSVSNVSDTFWHALTAVFNAASSTLFCGGSQGTSCSNGGTSSTTAATPGTNSIGGAVIVVSTAGSGTFSISEMGVWAGDQTSLRSSLNSNQISFWGPF